MQRRHLHSEIRGGVTEGTCKARQCWGRTTRKKPASDLKVEPRIGVKRKPRRILSIVSNTTELKGFPVGFFAEEMTCAFLMFTEAGHRVDLVSPKGGEVMFDTHSDPRTPDGAYANDLISLGFVQHPKFEAMLRTPCRSAASRWTTMTQSGSPVAAVRC